jgi:tRNA-dihydrouridine synthase B
MRIGSVEIDPPVFLAPMSGINDRSFRLLCQEIGAGAVWTGLLSANAVQFRSRKTEDMLRFAPEEHPVCAQVFGAEPAIVAQAAAEAERHGADMVDINLGCAVPKVLKGRAGAALMADPERAEAIVRACVQAVSCPVLAKMRSGWKDRGEDAVQLARRCERAGAAAVTIHPRWVGQRFLGDADWATIRQVKQAVSVPVIGSGDVRSAADALRMRSETGCDAVMIGQAALGNPWIFTQCAAALSGREVPAPPTLEERLALAERHVGLLVADRGEAIGVREMRKHLAWYLRGIPTARALRERTNRATRATDLVDILTAARGAAHLAGAIGGTR